jgi:glycosyltransferase involved in cell wall biosynthesis
MRVALLAETFDKNMGYSENLLPKHLARLGVEVHVITTDLPPNYHMKKQEFANTYGGFVGGNQSLPGVTETLEGFTLHVLPHRRVLGYMQIVGLINKLRSIRPDVVQATHVIGWTPLQSALAKPFLKYRLFSATHYHASVFPLSAKRLSIWNFELLRCRLLRALPGWVGSLFTEKCYAIAPDCADIASRFFGIPMRKIIISPLGVDTELFNPISNSKEVEQRGLLRESLGIAASDILCIYTGRFSEDKNPLLLAKAVERLAVNGERYRGLFVGNGIQAKSISACRGCVVHPFVPVKELRGFYCASDIGVWPTQESTSMLDAAACGLPIVANSSMSATERLDGNGVIYKLNDLDDLTRALLTLREERVRRKLGKVGAHKMSQTFSWTSIAKQRVQDYEAVLRELVYDEKG